MSAQDRYRAMLRDEIAPALRRRGFTGSGTAYVLPDDTHWLQVGFQSSRWNAADAARFTVNLSIADKAAWARGVADRGSSSRPNPNQRSQWNEVRRLGSLAFGEDRWWQVPERTAPVVASVLEALDRAGLPWLLGKNKPGP